LPASESKYYRLANQVVREIDSPHGRKRKIPWIRHHAESVKKRDRTLLKHVVQERRLEVRLLANNVSRPILASFAPAIAAVSVAALLRQRPSPVHGCVGDVLFDRIGHRLADGKCSITASMVLRKQGVLPAATRLFECLRDLFVISVGDSFEEKQREDIRLEVSRIHGAAQNICGLPQMV
jgi:hypothetical protein